ncbi:hypothetical protein BH11VER1_BH11VER1_00010 [soil metagenome]
MCRTYKLILIIANTLALTAALAVIGFNKATREPYAPNTVLDSASENQRDVTKLRSIVAISNARINLLEKEADEARLLSEKFLVFFGGLALMNLVILGLSQRSRKDCAI